VGSVGIGKKEPLLPLLRDCGLSQAIDLSLLGSFNKIGPFSCNQFYVGAGEIVDFFYNIRIKSLESALCSYIDKRIPSLVNAKTDDRM